ncbi:MAG: chromate transporter [Betaproteobacteria bacterium]|jgi:chromate transporter|uniref:chromate efflux transporter n=1 Tax=Limnobacter sp. 130 TaxID=2653147 RepID=UPI000DB817E5|nr:chromate efflux transporter [Limnobacter sp. 130]PZO17156.1 MAG: chromate transporter [Betaproteobacteria bacterium]VWX34849.1 Chromate transporter [Limnobacter sp. 130]
MSSNTLQNQETHSPSQVGFWEAFRFWLKLGFISFGGPAGQIAIMHQEVVEKKHWLSERRFLHALNYCMVLPGPEAQQLATYIGWLMHRTVGGVLAGVLFVLPSLLLLIILSWVYIALGDTPVVAGLFYGIKPAVTAIVFQAAHRIGSRALKNRILWTVAALSFVATAVFSIPFPLIVAMAALLGYWGGKVRPAQFSIGGGHASSQKDYGRALVDDNTPTPVHALFTWKRLIQVAAIGLSLWAVPMGLMTLYFGWEHTLTQMGWFFTKAALLTFGGAYAVLPYVYEGAVEHFSWLNATQMIDGLALGETTPGPLIIIVAFVGFVGAYLKEVFGPEQLFWAGVAGATVVTWFTFLPSFIFIFMGGPLIETTHNQPKLTAPLTAITAAVVGVILNLALFFGYHVLWPSGMSTTAFLSGFEWPAALIAVIATLALFKFKRGVIQVIIGSALLGLLVTQAKAFI